MPKANIQSLTAFLFVITAKEFPCGYFVQDAKIIKDNVKSVPKIHSYRKREKKERERERERERAREVHTVKSVTRMKE